MKKSILALLVLTASSSYAQIEVWMLNGTFSYFGQVSIKNTILPTAKLALVRSAGDTTWFDRRPDFIKFAFNPADLQTAYATKPRFSVGDSVTAFIWNQWHNAKVIEISDKRYLIAHEKFLYNPVTRIWVDFEKVEGYIYSKKYLSK